MVEKTKGSFQCPKCYNESEKPEHAIILNMEIEEIFGKDKLWCTFFSALAEKICGISAQKLKILEEENSGKVIEKIFDELKETGQYILRIRKDKMDEGNVIYF